MKKPTTKREPLKVQKPGGPVQASKHETIKTDRGEFKWREPKSAKWNE